MYGLAYRCLCAYFSTSGVYSRNSGRHRPNLTVPIVGHVGYGNFHLLFLIDSANEAEDLKQFQQLNDRLIERALKMGGPCTGEHGVGIGKIHYTRAKHVESVEMRQIKQVLDPLNLFNPGKLVPA